MEAGRLREARIPLTRGVVVALAILTSALGSGQSTRASSPPDPPSHEVAAAGFLSIPVGDPVYEDLEHFRALGLLRGGLELLPLTRSEAREAARAIREASTAQPLHPSDRRRLERLERALDLPPPGVDVTPDDRESESRDEGSAPPVSARDHLPGEPAAEGTGADPFPPVVWGFGGGIRFYGAASTLDSLIDLDRRQRREHLFWLQLDAALGSRVTVESRFYEDYSHLSPLPGGRGWVDNLPLDLEGILTDPRARNDRAVLGVGWSWGGVRLGREERRWGPGRWGTLFLSENPFPLDGISLRFRTRWVSGASLVALADRSPEDGWFAAHRIEVHPRLPVRFGLFEAVAWGGRGIDPAYTNPVGFLVAMTQDVVDRSGIDDKKVLGADATVMLAPVTLYGEFLLNRLVSMDAAEEGEESEISGFGELIGVRWANPFGWGGADLQAELAHLDPEVYFHHDGDPGRDLLSQDELIGHWAGPNSDLIWLALSAPPAIWGDLRIDLEQVRWGMVGGARGVEVGFLGLQRADRSWLTGDRQVERRIRLFWERRGWNLPLPGRWDTSMALAHVDRSYDEVNDDLDAYGGAGPGPGRWVEAGWQWEVRVEWSFGWNLIDGRGAVR